MNGTTYQNNKNSFFSIKNVIVIVLGFLTAVLGFYLLHIGGVSGKESMTYSPLLLCLAYLIIVPVGILLPSKKTKGD
jgi:hypothetical protein